MIPNEQIDTWKATITYLGSKKTLNPQESFDYLISNIGLLHNAVDRLSERIDALEAEARNRKAFG